MDLGLDGKIALVAGAGRDLGRATAVTLAREGAHVLLGGRSADMLEETAALIRGDGGRAGIHVFDAMDGDSVAAAVAAILAVHGRIDLFANTVGPFPAREPGTAPPYGSDASWLAAFDRIFLTAARLGRTVVPAMKAAGQGAVVNVLANSVRHYSESTAQYGAMKAALAHLVKNLARDVAGSGVRVNAVLPGWIRTAALDGAIASQAAEAGVSPREIERRMMAGHGAAFWGDRMGAPQEYADAIVFLLSERASYINGALVPVDGGSQIT
ncbi:SDR family oxidoreductase [Sphingopyxis panaciterrae]|uniref:SDR family oxidoreductase n=1 Tax=Sphingopyxis panaciterrae TaxID=363841 RepID=UPI001421FD19